MRGAQVGEAAAIPGLQRAVGADHQAVFVALFVDGDPAGAVTGGGQGVGFVGLEFHGVGGLAPGWMLLASSGLRVAAWLAWAIGTTTTW